MKNKFLLLFLLLPLMFFSQLKNIDLKSIKKNISDEQSHLFYERILYRYKGLPKTLDIDQSIHLYYGRNFIDNKVSVLDADFLDVVDYYKSQNWEAVVSKAMALLRKDPTNLDLLMILMQAYRVQGDESNFIFRLGQFRALVEAMRSSGDGTTEKKAFVVNSVDDEYILLNTENINVRGYKRTSQLVKDGFVDIWEKGSHKIYFRVLVNHKQ